MISTENVLARAKPDAALLRSGKVKGEQGRIDRHHMNRN